MRPAIFVLVLAVFFALGGAPLVHGLVPHEHEHDFVEETLHTSLRSENKRFLEVRALNVEIVGAITAEKPLRTVLNVAPGKLERALHRGIVKYRAFG